MLVLWLNINSPPQFMVSFIAYNNKGPERFAPSLYISYLNKKRSLFLSKTCCNGAAYSLCCGNIAQVFVYIGTAH